MKKLGILYAPRDSASAAALCREVPLYRIGPEGAKSEAGRRAFKYGKPRINWGSSNIAASTYSPGYVPDVYNLPGCVGLATSKLKTLTKLKEANVPALEATGEVSVAKQWSADGSIVLARRDGLSGGAGITKIGPDNMTPSFVWPVKPLADFYVKYWKKTHEYRFHVFRHAEGDGWQGDSTPLPSHYVIDTQQKRRRTEWTGTYDPMIRNFDNGWVFCHDNLKGTQEELAAMGATAVSAVNALGLDFGAVDVLARFKDSGPLSKHVVCEINTAPGLEGTTLQRYVQAIRSYLA